MEAGDIVNDLSTNNIAEDDLNGIFSSLEPLEDPKDDMFFFGGKDLLQSTPKAIPCQPQCPHSSSHHFHTLNIFM